MRTPWDLPKRLRAKVAVDVETACWLWIGARQSKGYGCGRDKGGAWLAHRRVHELLVGPIPTGLTIDHLCRTHRCVNPGHLEPVSRAENNRRAADDMLATPIYPCGHQRTAENSITKRHSDRPRPNAYCRECNRTFVRRWQESRKVAA